jgi:hypothetical protein
MCPTRPFGRIFWIWRRNGWNFLIWMVFAFSAPTSHNCLITSGIEAARQAEFGRPPPRSLPVDLLRRMIANGIQEGAFGTLDRATLKLLDGLAHRGSARRGERNLKIGTVLVRDYQGRRHTVTVVPAGYVWVLPRC